jgi:nucleoside-diphosphate-sugar epimerase
MYKYIGDSILNASFTVQVPKPLDNRTVVNNLQELYSIPPAYAYLGMTVANIDNGNIYMLVDKSKIYEKGGWKASYESIQIIACTYQEYKEWE